MSKINSITNLSVDKNKSVVKQPHYLAYITIQEQEIKR
jgi:hypothetical protein